MNEFCTNYNTNPYSIMYSNASGRVVLMIQKYDLDAINIKY